jgi:hypothetical protein
MKCRDVCKLGKCCFVGNDRCGAITDDPKFCGKQYKPCSVLYDGTLPSLPPSPSNGGNDGDGNGANDDYLDDDNYLYDDSDPRDHGGGNGTDDYYDDDDFVDDTYATGGENAWGVETDANGHPLLPDVSHLASDCDPKAINTNATAANTCLKRCKQAQCCLFESSLPQSCLAGNNAKCMEYQRWCGALFGNEDQTTTTVQEAPANLPSLCSQTSLATSEGMAECQKYCEPGKCCFSWESAEQCRTDTDCPSYAPCLNLKSLSQNHPTVQNSVNQACNANSVTTYDGYQACQQLCMSHVCCWAAEQSFCTADVNSTCPDYEGCKYLRIGANPSAPVNNTVYKDLPSPPSNLTEVCVAANGGNANAATECQKYCDLAECCDLPENLEGSCLKGNHLSCLRYHRGCAARQYGNEDTTSGITVTKAPLDLVAWCSVESLGTAYGMGKCQEECGAFPCCWTDSAEGSCHTQENCNGYAPCYQLRAGNSTNSAITNAVKEKCDAESIKTPEGLAVCQQVCLQHKCCWDVYDDKIEQCFGETACEQYSACTAALQQTVTDDYVYEGKDFLTNSTEDSGGRDRQIRQRL